MNRQARLMKAICERPDDDQPRIDYADFIEKKDAARAEFIRVQVELAQLEAKNSASQAIYSFLHRSDPRGAKMLSEWPALEQLQCLHLVGNNFSEDGARFIAASPYLNNKIKHLCVSHEKVGVAGMKALKKRFGRAVSPD